MRKFTKDDLERFLREIREENDWRSAADIESAYYDNKQLTAQQKQILEDRGLPPLTRNLIAPSVNLVLGMELKNRRNWKVIADDDYSQEVATALTPELVKYERATQADDACSEAFASLIKAGIGWVEVAKETDPFRVKYRVKPIHRREIYWDWRSREWDLSDARYLVRCKWIDLDDLEVHFPAHKRKLRNLHSPLADWDKEPAERDDVQNNMFGLWYFDDFYDIEEQEWRDLERRRIKLYEVWYRYLVDGFVMRLPNERIVEFDPSNMRHKIAVASGQAELESAKFPKIRRAFWAGPEMLTDEPTPYPHNRFPYVPFWCFREDGTGAPYGVIRSMVGPQDEVNARLSKMMWLLSAKRVIADADALDMPLEDMVEEVSQPNGVILLNENRKNKNADAFRVEQDFALSREQFEVMKDAQGAIQDASGIYQAMLGKESNVESGVGLDTLVEQGSTTLAKVFGNFARSRMLVGELLLSLIKADIGNQEKTFHDIEKAGAKQDITLNKRQELGNGLTGMSNSLAYCRTSVGLEETPDTPSYKRMLMQQFSEITKSLSPEVQSLFADFMVRISDLPFREEMVERLQQHLGLGEERGPSPIEQAEFEKLRAEIEKLVAETRKIMASTESEYSKASNLDAHTERALSEAAIKEDAHDMEMVEKGVELTRPQEK